MLPFSTLAALLGFSSAWTSFTVGASVFWNSLVVVSRQVGSHPGFDVHFSQAFDPRSFIRPVHLLAVVLICAGGFLPAAVQNLDASLFVVL